MRVEIDQEVPAYQSYAAERTRGLYNVEVEDGRRFRMAAELPAEEQDWQIGVVVGPSGSGKTSIARALHEQGWQDHQAQWPRNRPIIDVLATAQGDYGKATAALAAVGLGSVPSWLRPHEVLSNGEQFRADLAELALKPVGDRFYVDEFTSVLDRQVAKVGAGAFAKQWRRKPGRQIILITPHYDILDWVEPDWVLDTAGGERLPGEERKVVQARKGDFQAAVDHGRYPGDTVGTVVC